MTRAQIRADVRARLVAAGIAPSAQVIASMAFKPQGDHPSPLVLIYTGAEVSTRVSAGGGIFERRTDIIIEAAAHATGTDATLDDTLDALAESIENALLTSPTFLAQFERVDRIDRDTSVDTDSDRRRGAVRLTIPVVQHVEFVPINAAEADFTLMRARIDLQPIDGQMEAIANVVLAGPP